MKNPVIDNIKSRRSCRKYSAQQIPDSEMEVILDVGIWAPSGRNTQNWKFVVVQKPDVLARLNEAVKTLQNRGSDYCCYYGAPVLVLVCHITGESLAPFDCACALENMFLAAHSMGIASCWINQVGQLSGEPEIRGILTELGIPENYSVYGCGAFGYADMVSVPPQRKEGTIKWVK